MSVRACVCARGWRLHVQPVDAALQQHIMLPRARNPRGRRDSNDGEGKGKQLHLGSFYTPAQAVRQVAARHMTKALLLRGVAAPLQQLVPDQAAGGTRASTCCAWCAWARRAYDRAALLMRGPSAETNRPASEYASDPHLPHLRTLEKRDMVLAIRKLQDIEVRRGMLVHARTTHLLHQHSAG